jgi:hypothetical protein
VNPPPGAFTCYVIGDIGAIGIANRLRARYGSKTNFDRTPT